MPALAAAGPKASVELNNGTSLAAGGSHGGAVDSHQAWVLMGYMIYTIFQK